MKSLTYGWVIPFLFSGALLQAQESAEKKAIEENSSPELPAPITSKLIPEDQLNPAVLQLPQLLERIQIEHLAAKSPYVLLPYKPNYILPVTWQSSPSDAEFNKVLQNITGDPDAKRSTGFDEVELMFQISIQAVLAEDVIGKHSRIAVAYTNRSFWQAYNTQLSRPFRETNHEPEIILSWLPQHNWIDYFSLSFNHQSNGQTSTLSRSWNRIIVDGATVFPIGILRARLWWRLPEPDNNDGLNPAGDDNPDILHYMGPGELQFIYARGRNTFSIMARNNFDFHRNKGAVELGWSLPLDERFKLYVQYFNGYGESMLDYNRSNQRLGIGIQLSDWL